MYFPSKPEQLMLNNELVAGSKVMPHVPMSTSSDQITSPSNLLEAEQQC
jgi:hypothetical protein